MRTKNGKKIGPVPITLVAVFALVTVISAGLWLTANSGVTQAQGLPSDNEDSASNRCAVAVAGDTDSVTNGDQNNFGDTVMGGGCIVSGDSVDVMFRNYHAANDQFVAVYVSGGDDYSSVQAMDGDDEVGAKGLDEHLLTIGEAGTAIGGVSAPGSQSVTVSRDMAEDGEVYLFAYIAGDTANQDDYKQFQAADVGIPLNLLDNTDATAYRNRVFASATTEVDAMISSTNTAIGTAQGAVVTSGLSVSYQGTNDDEANYLPDVDSVSHDSGMIALERDALEAAEDAIRVIMGDSNYGDEADDDATPRVVGTATLEGQVETAETDIAAAKAAIEAIEDQDARYFFPRTEADMAVKVVFRDNAVAAKLVSGVYNPEHDKGTAGSTLFVGRGAENAAGDLIPVADDEAADDITGTAEIANVTVKVRDSRGISLKGFVEFVVDTSAEGAGNAVFAGSSRTTQYVELSGGMATVQVTELAKNDPLRIPVSANFNSGELELATYIVRKGDAMMVEAAAYACEVDSDDPTEDHDGDESDGTLTINQTARRVTANTICDTEIDSDDPAEVVALGPGESFFIRASATDAVGNNVGKGTTLSWKVTPSSDNEDDADDSIAGDADSGNTHMPIMIADDDNAVPGTYSLTVTSPDGEADTMIMVTVSDDASMIMVTCDPVMVPTDTGQTDCVVMVTDANGNIPSNLGESDSGDDTIQVTVRSRDAQIIGVDERNRTDIDEEGMATFSILLREDAVEGSSITVNVSTSEIGDATLRESVTVTYGMAQPEMMAPGMPMNVMAMATSHDMITVSWDAVMDATSYMVERGYMDADNMMMWMTVAEMTTDMMYMDSGLMAETTYYYRVTAMNDAGYGDASDGTAMATTMMATTMMDELGTTTDIGVGFNRGGALQVYWTKAANAMGYIIVAINTADSTVGGDPVVLNDGDAETRNISGLTPGATYDIYVIATGSGGAFELGEPHMVTAQ